MSISDLLDAYAVGIVYLAAIPANAFPLTYVFRPWRKSFLGRALMVKAVGIALLIDEAIVGNQFPDYSGQHLIRAIVFTTVVTGITLQYIALVKSSWARDLSDEHEHDDEPERIHRIRGLWRSR